MHTFPRRLLLASFVLISLVIVLRLLRSDVFAAGKTYYVHCSAGNDSNAGTSADQAWKNITKANTASLGAGDTLYLAKGCTWTTPLNVKWSGTASSPVTITAYGSGSAPLIQVGQMGQASYNITGSYVVLDGLAAKGIPVRTDASCQNQAIGDQDGFRLDKAKYVTVKNSTATGFMAGVHILYGSTNNKILNNTLTNNTLMSIGGGGDDDFGAFGINIEGGNDNEVAYNTITGGDACSKDYSRDGSAIEIFDGSRNTVHHNYTNDNNSFTELGVGEGTAADNTFAYNIVVSKVVDSSFIITRGGGDNWGTVPNTRMYNNVVYFTGKDNILGDCSGCTKNKNILTMKNNIFWVDGEMMPLSTITESNNIYWNSTGNPDVNLSGSNSKKANPLFVNLAGGDFRIQNGSPAVHFGVDDVITAGFTTDYSGTTVPAGNVDVGAYQLGSSGSPVPSTLPTASPTPIACTADAKICPDGSAVGRTGPNCAFAPCPKASPSPRATRSPRASASPSSQGNQGNRRNQCDLADFNKDGVVDNVDYRVIAKAYFQRDRNNQNTLEGDLNNDDVIDLRDFSVFRRMYNHRTNCRGR